MVVTNVAPRMILFALPRGNGKLPAKPIRFNPGETVSLDDIAPEHRHHFKMGVVRNIRKHIDRGLEPPLVIIDSEGASPQMSAESAQKQAHEENLRRAQAYLDAPDEPKPESKPKPSARAGK